MDTREAIGTFRAIRQFQDRPLPDEDVRAILNAGRRAQSSKNTQPWQFVAVRNRETLRALSRTGDFAAHLAGAAVGVALVSPPVEQAPWVFFDLGQTTACMQLAAWDLGIGSCIAAVYHPERAAAILGIPHGMECRVALSFGSPLVPVGEQPPPRRGGRMPLEEVVHWERW